MNTGSEPSRDVPHEAGAEQADVASSSDDYATRFAGPTGAWMLDVQAQRTLELLTPWRGGSVLDVGGGHNQLAPPLTAAGHRVKVLGSREACGERVRRVFSEAQVPFVTGDILDPPFPDRSFDAVLAFRLMAHVADWPRLVRGLCRVARHAVIVDFAATRSLNAIAAPLFEAKKRVERNTRPFALQSRGDVAGVFREAGFPHVTLRPQFALPMVVHRVLRSPGASRALEAPLRWAGVTRWLGSPVVMRATREPVR